VLVNADIAALHGQEVLNQGELLAADAHRTLKHT
jgi:hypothetical protein